MEKLPFKLSDLTIISFLRQMLGDQIKENESALHFLLNNTKLPKTIH